MGDSLILIYINKVQMSIEELQEQVLDFPTYKSLRACTLAFLAVLLLALLVKIAHSENYVYFFYKLVLSRHERLHIQFLFISVPSELC